MNSNDTPQAEIMDDNFVAPEPVKATNEVAVSHETSKAVAVTTEEKMIDSLMALATNPDTDVDKAERFLEMQFKMMDRKAKMDFDQALADVQADMPRITQRGEIKNKSGQVVARYMKYEDIDTQIRPRLEQHGFSLLHNRDHVDGKMVVTTKLKHRGGHEESVSIPLPYDKANALKSDLQAAVGTFSVGKRVNVCSLLNIVQEGEDGAGSYSDAIKITEEQAANIKERLQSLYEAGADIDTKRLLKFIGANSVDEIPATKHQETITLLDRKEAALPKAGA